MCPGASRRPVPGQPEGGRKRKRCVREPAAGQCLDSLREHEGRGDNVIETNATDDMGEGRVGVKG